MMNFYPYYVFMQNRGVVPIENSLFKPLTPAKEEVDPNTLLHYTNVLDAMIDSAYFSMKNLNVTDVAVLVTETGWPSKVVLIKGRLLGGISNRNSSVGNF